MMTENERPTPIDAGTEQGQSCQDDVVLNKQTRKLNGATIYVCNYRSIDNKRCARSTQGEEFLFCGVHSDSQPERQCVEVTRNGHRCKLPAMSETDTCFRHTTSADQKLIARRMVNLAEPAVQMLYDALRFADYATGVKAAAILLDRVGFGPTRKLTIDDQRKKDFGTMSDDELFERLDELRAQRQAMKALQPAPDAEVIESPQVTVVSIEKTVKKDA